MKSFFPQITLSICSYIVLSGFFQGALAQATWEQEFAALREQVEAQQKVIDAQAMSLAEQQLAIDNMQGAQEVKHPAGYKNGFIIAESNEAPATKGSNYLMRVGSWGQLRHNFFDSHGTNPDQNDMEFERLRLVFNGHAFNPTFQYFFQMDADADIGSGGNAVDMLDYYLTYDFGHDLFGCEKNALRVRLGKWKIGFNRAREESGTRMQFSDRSVASVLFDFDRSTGIGFLGTIDRFDWQIAVANGIDTGGYRPNRLQLDRNFALATRINYLLTGDWGNDGHADLDWREVPAIRLGSGFTYSRRDIDGIREFSFPRVVDSGAPIATVLPAGVTAYNQYMASADVNIKYRGWSFIFEYYLRQFDGFSGAAVPGLLDHGMWSEIGYFVIPEHLQLLARHSRAVGNSGTVGGFDESADEVAVGAVLYFRRQNLKLTFDATRVNGVPINDLALGLLPGDDGMLYRTQFQWKF